MPSIYSGIRTWIGALQKGADNIVTHLIGMGDITLEIESALKRKFPDLGPVERQQVIDFTYRSMQFGSEIAVSPGSTVLNNAASPLNPARVGKPVYWVEVDWTDPQTGEIGSRLVALRGNAGETKAEFERRAIEQSIDWWDESPEYDDQGRKKSVKFIGVKWLRGYRGTGI